MGILHIAHYLPFQEKQISGDSAQSMHIKNILKNISVYDNIQKSCPGARNGVCYMYKWGHITVASIRGGMSMISTILTFVSFGAFLLDMLFRSSVLPRLLGVILA